MLHAMVSSNNNACFVIIQTFQIYYQHNYWRDIKLKNEHEFEYLVCPLVLMTATDLTSVKPDDPE